MRQPFYLVDIIVGSQFAAACLAEVAEHMDGRQFTGVHVLVQQLTLLVASERGVWLVHDAGFDSNLVDAECDIVRTGIGR